MKQDRITKEKIAEKSAQELTISGDLKKLPDSLAQEIAKFFESKSLQRLQTARLIYNASQNKETQSRTGLSDYSDYSEVVSAAYYSMYYIVHAYLASAYKTKLREGMRGVHSITHNLIIHYLVKTRKLAKHLYEEYLRTLETAADVQSLSVASFQDEAYQYAEGYDRTRTSREIFTYNTAPSVEAHHADRALATAEEFVNTVRQLMLKE